MKRSPPAAIRAVPVLLLALFLSAGPGQARVLPDAREEARVERRWVEYLQTPGQEIRGRFPYLVCFREAAEAQRLPLSLLLAVARGESNFDPRARSGAGALGLMQILWPQTANHLGITRRERLFDPCTNVAAGARYLRELLDRYDGDLHRTLAAYNYGPGRIPQDRDRPIPAGASWYSAYIQDHLESVLNGAGRPPDGGGSRVLIRFSRPYRAAALVERLRPLLGDLRIDWFRRRSGEFEVVLEYRDQAQLKQGRRTLSRLGFRL